MEYPVPLEAASACSGWFDACVITGVALFTGDIEDEKQFFAFSAALLRTILENKKTEDIFSPQ